MSPKLLKFREILKSKGIEAALISKLENIRYLSNFSGSSGYILITLDSAYFITDFRYIEQAHQECVGYEILEHNQQRTIYTILNNFKFKNLGFEENNITYYQYIQLKEKLNKVQMIPLGDLIDNLRIIKYPNEINLIQKSATIVDEAFEYICNYIKPGLTEIEIALEIEKKMKSLGASALAFDIIVASGIRSSLPHGLPSNKTLENGDLLVLDFGCIYNGYCSDMTRTLVLGKASQRQKDIYDIVLNAQVRALENIRSDILAKDIDKIARDIITKNGYGENFGHGTGHGVGLEIHEPPKISPLGEVKLKKNMVFTIEPGIYIPGFGGIRIEDLVVVTDNGVNILSKSPKKFVEL